MNSYSGKMKQIFLMALFVASASWSGAATHQATGFKVGELDQDSAVIWTRYTLNEARIASDSSCPGSNGYVRVRYSTDSGLAGAVTTAWTQVDSANDYTHQLTISNLTPNQTYHLATDTDDNGLAPFSDGSLTGQFHTAASATQSMDVVFTVITGTKYSNRGTDEVDGFNTFVAMKDMNPDFIVPTGDTEYFDTDADLYAYGGETGRTGDVQSMADARYRWNRHFALPRTVELYKTVPAYWCVDDHDLLRDDAWPGDDPWPGSVLTFAEGVSIFQEQVPLDGRLTYRTKRWGKNLQIWMTEGRFYRDESNSHPGTPSNYPTMWGDTQKQWFKDTVTTNDATWKVLISPTPFIGPDFKDRGDNYAYHEDGLQRTYDYEAQEVRDFMQETAPADMFVVCGDRHWQYHAIDPTSKLHEFSCGTASDEHAGSGLDPTGTRTNYHQFYRTKGGFASVEITNQPHRSTITFNIHDEVGVIVDSWSKDALMPGEDALGTMTISGVTRDTNFKLQLSETSNDLIQVIGDLDLGDPTDDADPMNVRQTDLLLSTLPGENPSATYTLVTYTGSLSGSFDRVIGLPENAALDFSTLGEINLIVQARIDVVANAVSVPEGGTTTVGVRLTSEPESETTVTVTHVSGDSDITVQSGGSLIFTTSNWMTWQYPVLAAATDADWANSPAVIRCAMPEVPNVDITATEADNDYAKNEALPWSETFETAIPNAGTPGDVSGQHGWSVSGEGSATVQSDEVRSGSQALAISGATASHTFTGSASNVWISLWAKPVMRDTIPSIPSNTAAAFYVNIDTNLVAYNSTNGTILAGATVSNGWNQFEIDCDYSSKVWNLTLNGTQVVTNFDFYGSSAAFQALEMVAESTNAAYADDIDITGAQGAPDTDSDGLPDWWEIQYYGGATNAIPDAMASNGVNSVKEAYIAGFNPTNPAASFLISNLSPLISENVLQWQGVSGRVYTVYWTSNLLTGFGSPLTNNLPWTGSTFTDTTHSATDKGFYKIEVEVE